MRTALLALEDGRVFPGEAYGATGQAVGEAVFATGMTGYQETLTDPSYRAQVLVMTAPHIGNTGINDEDCESTRMWPAGLVVRDPARRPSSWRSRGSLDAALAREGVVGIAGVDTRAVTRHLRQRGVMRAGISSGGADVDTLLAVVRSAPPMAGADLSAEVTTTRCYVVPAIGRRLASVAAIDFGLKASTPALLARRGIEVHVLPAWTGVDEIAARGVDGVVCSNGPGDPAAASAAVALVRQILERRWPCLGICFGHQVLGRALGFATYKLPFGHRGLNCPVQDLASGAVEVSAHNHGFALDAPVGRAVSTAYGRAEVTHVCLNDGVVEGIALRNEGGEVLAFGVQYHPEAAAGPHDSEHLFDRFASMVVQAAAADGGR